MNQQHVTDCNLVKFVKQFTAGSMQKIVCGRMLYCGICLLDICRQGNEILNIISPRQQQPSAEVGKVSPAPPSAAWHFVVCARGGVRPGS